MDLVVILMVTVTVPYLINQEILVIFLATPRALIL